MNAITRYFCYLRKTLWSLITISDRIDRLETQLKILSNVNNNIFSFIHRGTEIKLLLPQVGYDALQNIIVSEGDFYENNLLVKAAKYIPKNATIADCGCNIGNHSVYFAKICNAERVISFDPQPLCASTCAKNMALNNVEKRSLVIQKAIGKENGLMKVAQEIHGNCAATRFCVDNTGDIPVTTLDSCHFEKLDFIKIDIEGGQLDLILGAKETLRRFHPNIWIELLSDNGSPTYDVEREYSGPINELAKLGYTIAERIDSDNYIFCVDKN